MNPRPLGAPTRLTAEHETSGFRGGDDVLDSWLRHHALSQYDEGVTTFAVTKDSRVVGYYCLTRGAVEHTRAATRGWRARRGPVAPPVPALVIGRLTVDETVQGRGVGASLLRDAIMRSATVYRTAGLPLLLAHTATPAARTFFAHFGFAPTRFDPHVVALALRHATAGPRTTFRD